MIGMIRRLHVLKRDVVSSVGSHGLNPVIGSVRGRPEVGCRPSDRRVSGLNPTGGTFGGFELVAQEDGGLMDPLDGRGYGADGFGQTPFCGECIHGLSEEKAGRLERGVTVHLVAFDQKPPSGL